MRKERHTRQYLYFQYSKQLAKVKKSVIYKGGHINRDHTVIIHLTKYSP